MRPFRPATPATRLLPVTFPAWTGEPGFVVVKGEPHYFHSEAARTALVTATIERSDSGPLTWASTYTVRAEIRGEMRLVGLFDYAGRGAWLETGTDHLVYYKRDDMAVTMILGKIANLDYADARAQMDAQRAEVEVCGAVQFGTGQVCTERHLGLDVNHVSSSGARWAIDSRPTEFALALQTALDTHRTVCDNGAQSVSQQERAMASGLSSLAAVLEDIAALAAGSKDASTRQRVRDALALERAS